MISKSNINVAFTLTEFKEKNLNPVFIVPTATGLNKSIMDATETVRSFLEENEIHNFKNQKQGEENKVILNIDIVSKNKIFETKLIYIDQILKMVIQDYGFMD